MNPSKTIVHQNYNLMASKIKEYLAIPQEEIIEKFEIESLFSMSRELPISQKVTIITKKIINPPREI